MASIIKLKRSNTPSSVPSSLQEGEIAVNLKDKKLYVGNTTGVFAVSGDIATTTTTGVASFDSGDFAVSGAGAVTIKTGGVDNGQLAADAVDATKLADDAVGAEHIADDAVGAAAIADNAVTSAAIAAKTIVAADIADATITSTQLASGAITANAVATNSVALGSKTTGNYVATVSGSGGVSVSGSGSETASVTVSLGDNISANTSGKAATADALTSAVNIGGVSFDGSSSINLPGVNATGNQNTTGTAAGLTTARTIAIAGDQAGSATFDGTGNISISTTTQINSVDLGTHTTGNYASAVTGTTNEVEVTGSAGEGTSFQVGLPNDVTISNDLTVSGAASVVGNVTIDGNLTVEGATTYISSSTVNVDDSAIKLSANNSADTVDIGMYGKYVDGATTKFGGWHRDASDSGIYKFYKDITAEPTTTVNTAHASYAIGQIEAVIDGGSY